MRLPAPYAVLHRLPLDCHAVAFIVLSVWSRTTIFIDACIAKVNNESAKYRAVIFVGKIKATLLVLAEITPKGSIIAIWADKGRSFSSVDCFHKLIHYSKSLFREGRTPNVNGLLGCQAYVASGLWAKAFGQVRR